MMQTRIRRTVFRCAVLAAFAPLVVAAQQRSATPGATLHRIGYLGLRPMTETAASLAALKDGLRELGHLEGSNYVLEVRLADDDPDRYPALIAELTALKVELIVAASTPAAIAIHAANPAMPIVIGRGPDLVGAGLANSAGHPGGVATGIEELAPGMIDKRFRFLKQAVPTLSRVAVLSSAPTEGAHVLQYREAEQTAKAIGVTIRPYRVSAATDFGKVFDDITKDGAEGVLGLNGVLARPVQRNIVELAAHHHLPAIYPAADFVQVGGFMSLGQRSPEMFRFAATYVDKIFRGAKPGDLPLTSWSRLYLSVNTKTAAALGITLPPSLLSQADEVVK
jgi:putative tryptophan/tyrosine transport system substrate-binding protein